MIKTSAEEIARFYLNKESMTPKKLQKIMYFAYSWYLALMNDNKDEEFIKLFDEDFEAWIHGPVCPSIFQKYKHYRGNMIPQILGDYKNENLNSEDIEILDEVWQVYGSYTANQLESISHQHDPWKKTREKNNCGDFSWCNDKIDNELIFEYYITQMD